jgi:hypothetical protein
MRMTHNLVRRFFKRKPPLLTQRASQICLFNERPVLHQNVTQQTLQAAIDDLQMRLHDKGYLASPSGRFDDETEQAVRAFQRNHHLFVDGVVGPLTWSCLCYPKLSYRSHHWAVENGSSMKRSSPAEQLAICELQEILKREGWRIQDEAGNFGRDTERAIKQFQRKYGLKVDGVVGAVTWAVLLGMRQEAPQAFFRLPQRSLLLCDQVLRVSCIVFGMYVHPFSEAPPLLSSIAIAYVLTLLVPSLWEGLPIKPFSQTGLYLFRYAPYVFAGLFWQAIFDVFLPAFFNRIQ